MEKDKIINAETDENALIKITTARVQLQKEQPFFSYLTMSLRMIKDESFGTAGVDAIGNLYYNPSFIDSLTKAQTKTLLAHEAMHCALLHCSRIGERKPFAWNVACDIIVNNLLVLNRFDFSGNLKDAIVPRSNSYAIGGEIIEEIDKKFVEEIYDLICKHIKEKTIICISGKSGDSYRDSRGNYKQLDKHINGKGKDKETIEEKQAREKAEREWKGKLSQAYQYAKNQGQDPSGMERLIDEILQNKLNWRELLHKFIVEQIPYDFNYSMPSKKSIATGYYLPSVVKEDTLEVTVAIDTSGSVNQEQLKEFLSEVYGIGRSFTSVKMHILFWDTKLQGDYKVSTNELSDLLSVKISGGGGTNFRKVNEYIEEEIPKTKLLIFFTDGYADFPIEEKYKTLWVLTKEHAPTEMIPFGDSVIIE